jgi:hypothetical protein
MDSTSALPPLNDEDKITGSKIKVINSQLQYFFMNSTKTKPKSHQPVSPKVFCILRRP